jgi:hypothetical protein
MVSTRIGKSSNPLTSSNTDSVKSIVIAKYPLRMAAKVKKETQSSCDLGDLPIVTEISEEQQESVKIFTIDGNSNRLSHNHLRFQSPELKMSSSPTLTVTTKSLLLSEKKNKREFEEIQDGINKLSSTPLLSESSNTENSNEKQRKFVLLMPPLPSLQVFPTEEVLTISPNLPVPPLSLNGTPREGETEEIMREITTSSTTSSMTTKENLPRISSNKENSSSQSNESKFSTALKDKILASKLLSTTNKPWKSTNDLLSPTEEIQSISSDLLTTPLSLSSILGEGVKKIIINEEEKAMNGAPEGELYDVILLNDSELPQITLSLNQAMIMDCFSLYFTLESKEGWAKQYEVVTFLRQLLYHHLKEVCDCFQEITLRQEFIRLCLKVFSDSLLSLRSSNIRNALFAIRLFFQPAVYRVLCPSYGESTEENEDFIWKLEEFSQLTTQLLMKTGNNPKFISSEALVTLQQVISESSFLYLLPSTSSCSTPSMLRFFNETLLLNKNGDISMNGITLLEEKCKSSFACKEDLVCFLSSSSRTAQRKEQQNNNNLIKTLYLCLTQAKKPQAKEKTKGLFSYFLSNYYENNSETFQSEILLKYLTDKEAEEIIREITKSSTTSYVTTKPNLRRTFSNKENSTSHSNESKFSAALKDKILASKSLPVTSNKPWKSANDLKSVELKNNKVGVQIVL